MRDKVHGVMSLGLIISGLCIAVAYISLHSIAAAALYLGIILISAVIILYAYCSKCPIRFTGCRHVFPGRVSGLLPPRTIKPYGALDYIGVAVPVTVLMAIPQYWLIRSAPALILFWTLIMLGAVDIVLYVCPACGNEHCPMRGPRRKFMGKTRST
ncbi:MAG: hypothetical protein HKM93_21820 [Desulfobacteraceae bacterium]|nr:hypothetical protein [Desulfobacteraceae bacterium]